MSWHILIIMYLLAYTIPVIVSNWREINCFTIALPVGDAIFRLRSSTYSPVDGRFSSLTASRRLRVSDEMTSLDTQAIPGNWSQDCSVHAQALGNPIQMSTKMNVLSVEGHFDSFFPSTMGNSSPGWRPPFSSVQLYAVACAGHLS